MEKFKRMLPHAAILICNMYIVFFLIDRVNPAMNFIDNPLTKGLLWILCAAAGCTAWMLIRHTEPLERPQRQPRPAPARREPREDYGRNTGYRSAGYDRDRAYGRSSGYGRPSSYDRPYADRRTSSYGDDYSGRRYGERRSYSNYGTRDYARQDSRLYSTTVQDDFSDDFDDFDRADSRSFESGISRERSGRFTDDSRSRASRYDDYR